jgi:hypothetical protein
MFLAFWLQKKTLEIDTTKLVSFFKDIIKRNQKPFFDNVASKELKLWKVDIFLEEGMIHLRARKYLGTIFNVVDLNKGKFCAKHKQSEMIDIFFYNDYRILFMIVNFNTNGL